jgi:hypothetical protein
VKKLLQILSSIVIGTAFIGSFAGATDCSGAIEGTGPGSNNQISCTDTNNIVVTCMNNVIVGTVNNQTGNSGSGNIQFNTSTGQVLTGQVVNNNGTNVTIGATGCGGTPATTVEAPGQGDFSPPAGGAGAAGPEELPNTASAPVAAIFAGSIAIAAVLAAASRLAVTAYRHFTIK